MIILSPRTGRPKIDNPKNVEIKIRFSQNANEKMLKYSKENNITRAETIRHAVDLLLTEEK